MSGDEQILRAAEDHTEGVGTTEAAIAEARDACAQPPDFTQPHLYPVIVGPGMKAIIKTVDDWLDGQVAEPYKDQPLAQDWARVAKCAEEISEVMEAAEDMELTARDRARLDRCTMHIGRAVDALIKSTGQNPRKGVCGSQEDMLKELGDVFATAVFAIQHFTGDIDLTTAIIEAALVKALNRATGAAKTGTVQPGVNSPSWWTQELEDKFHETRDSS